MIYLSATLRQILERTAHDRNRPLLQVDNPREVIERLLHQRDPLYREIADLVVDSDSGVAPQSLAETIVSRLRYLN